MYKWGGGHGEVTCCYNYSFIRDIFLVYLVSNLKFIYKPIWFKDTQLRDKLLIASQKQAHKFSKLNKANWGTILGYKL